MLVNVDLLKFAYEAFKKTKKTLDNFGHYRFFSVNSHLNVAGFVLYFQVKWILRLQ